jgi:uncharacterized protein (TIGR04255 family)
MYIYAMIPKVLKNPPIVEAVCELRFSQSNKMPSDIAASNVFAAINSEGYSPPTQLPIMQLPADVRALDKNLVYASYYRMSNNDFSIQFGPRAILISMNLPYKGWDIFYNEIKNIITNVLSSSSIVLIERVGLRVINFFDFDVIEETEIKWSNKPSYDTTQYNHSVVYTKPSLDIKARLQIANNSNFEKDNTTRHGSFIDIDAYSEKVISKDLGSVLFTINNLHDFEKEIFFTTLKDSLINKFEPTYD